MPSIPRPASRLSLVAKAPLSWYTLDTTLCRRGGIHLEKNHLRPGASHAPVLLTLSGCQNSGGETAGQEFESLGASFEDGKTVTVDMNREEVLEEMGGEPDDWTAKYGLIAYYGAQSPYEVTSLQYVGQEEMPFSTSLGRGYGGQRGRHKGSPGRARQRIGGPVFLRPGAGRGRIYPVHRHRGGVLPVCQWGRGPLQPVHGQFYSGGREGHGIFRLRHAALDCKT